jgi:glycosyltransferase involved in cell wall biosynthesis
MIKEEWILVTILNRQRMATSAQVTVNGEACACIEVHPTNAAIQDVLFAKPSDIIEVHSSIPHYKNNLQAIEFATKPITDRQAFWKMMHNMCMHSFYFDAHGFAEAIAELEDRWSTKVSLFHPHSLMPGYRTLMNRRRIDLLKNSLGAASFLKSARRINHTIPSERSSDPSSNYTPYFRACHLLLEGNPLDHSLKNSFLTLCEEKSDQEEAVLLRLTRQLLDKDFSACASQAIRLIDLINSSSLKAQASLLGLSASILEDNTDPSRILAYARIFYKYPNFECLYLGGLLRYLPFSEINAATIYDRLDDFDNYNYSSVERAAAILLIQGVSRSRSINTRALSTVISTFEAEESSAADRDLSGSAIALLYEVLDLDRIYDHDRFYTAELNSIHRGHEIKRLYGNMRHARSFDRVIHLPHLDQSIAYIPGPIDDETVVLLNEMYEQDSQWFSTLSSVSDSIKPANIVNCHSWHYQDRLGRAGNSLFNIIKQLHEKDISHVYLLPWVLAGGADYIATTYMNAVMEKHNNQPYSSTIVCLLTSDRTSERLDLVPKGVDVIDIGVILSPLSECERALFLAHLLNNIRPCTCHIINSREGYQTLERYGTAIRARHRIAVTVFCSDINSYGVREGYATLFREAIIRHCDYIFSDNNTYLAEAFGDALGSDCTQIIKSLYTPVFNPHGVLNAQEKKSVIAPPSAAFSKDFAAARVIWAGRFDSQKRLDILLAVADSMPDVTFEIYGYALFSDQEYWNLTISKRHNVVNMGKYSSFFDLDSSRYTCFVMTSEWEGLPVVLIEAALSRLPIVAPDVGGVRELICDSTGFLVSNYSDIGEYKSAIRAIMADPISAQKRNNNLLELVSSRHSFKAFADSLASTGYLS